MVSDIRRILTSQEGADDQYRLVSVTHALSVTEYTLTVAQTPNRLAVSTAEDPEGLTLYTVCQGNLYPLHRGSSLDGTS